MPTGTFAGYASVFGRLDMNGEVVDKGAFVNLTDWLARGTILWGHNTERPVGYPTEAVADDVGLFIRGAFHSTAEGEAARTWGLERKAAGLAVGLSIGYLVLRDSLVSGIRHLISLALLEVSFVAIPANPFAGATDIKAAPGELVLQPAPKLLLPDRSELAKQTEIQRLLARFNGVDV